jgi:hypothetical protein
MPNGNTKESPTRSQRHSPRAWILAGLATLAGTLLLLALWPDSAPAVRPAVPAAGGTQQTTVVRDAASGAPPKQQAPAERHELATPENHSDTTTIYGRATAAETEAPLAGVVVQLNVWPVRGNDTALADWHGPPDVITAADGTFVFRIVPHPELEVGLHLTAAARIEQWKYWSPLRTGITVDTGDIALEAGTPLQIRVVDAEVRPCPCIEVSANLKADHELRSTMHVFGRTNADGVTSSPNCVRPGTWRCELQGGLAGDLVVEFEVPLQGAPFTHTITVPVPPPDRQVSGTVVDTRGAPVADLELHCALPGGGFWPERTDGTGSFLFVHRPFWPGKPKFRLQLPQERTDLELVDDGGEFAWGTRGLKLVVRRFAAASFAIQVVDGRTGAPVESFGARCRPESISFRSVFTSPVPPTTHADGSQHFGDLAPGWHLVSVFPQAPLAEVLEARCELHEGEARTLRIDTWPAAELQVEVVDAATGQPVRGVEIALARALPETAIDKVSLSTYHLDRHSGGGGTMPVVLVLDHATSDVHGMATVHGARNTPGLLLRASGDCCLPTMQKAVTLSSPRQSVRIAVETAALLHGQLRPLELLRRFGPSPEKIALAAKEEQVTLPQPDRFAGDYGTVILQPVGATRPRLETDIGTEGAWRIGGVPVGRYEVRYSKTNNAVLATVELHAGEEKQLDLDATHLMPGRATGSFFVDGVPWQGKVRFEGLGDNGNTETAISDANGAATSPWLLPGTYLPSVQFKQGNHTHHIFDTVPFTLAPGGEVHFTADLHRRSVTVTLLDADGKPVADHMLFPELLDHPEYSWTWRYGTRTDARGVAVFDPIPPGRVQIRAFSAEQDPQERDAEPALVLGEVGALSSETTLRLPR